jgi:K(+)-stimulated pyrophosphate-energized sodium pump
MVFTSTNSRHVREIVPVPVKAALRSTSSPASWLSNFSAYWLGMAMLALMSVGFYVSTMFPLGLMLAPAVFALGLVAFGFLGMGPVTIAVDSYGPVTDNLLNPSTNSPPSRPFPASKPRSRNSTASSPSSKKPRRTSKRTMAQGNTFKATSKPVLIGTAVVGATTMIFSTIVALTNGLKDNMDKLSMMHTPFLFGLIVYGAGHLLVHRRQRPGRHYRRLPGSGIHQEEHQARYRGEGIRV